MAKKKAESQPVPPSMPPEKAIAMLRAHVEKGKGLLKNRPISGPNERSWEAIGQDLLLKTFGSPSPHLSSFASAGYAKMGFGGGGEEEWERDRAECVQERVTLLEGVIEQLEAELQLKPASAGGPSSAKSPPAPAVHATKVFLVHGHNEAILHEVARFLEQLDLEVVILREQPNEGRTIIEKFADYSDVGFAVVLLTGDDRGGQFGAGLETQKPRARQNVILELGYFLGKLGRNRVCALYQGGVEIPSDYNGVLFISLDTGGGWRLQLAREIRAAGFQIDMNRAL